MNKSIPKRLMSALLLIVIMCFCVNAYGEAEDEDNSATIFDTVLLGVVDNNAKEWMGSEGTRALFSACAILDYGLQEDSSFNITSFASNAGPIYVGRAGFIVSAFFCDTENDVTLSVMLDTRDNTHAGYGVFSYGKVLMEMAVENACTDGYYKVDIVDFKEAMDGIMEALQS